MNPAAGRIIELVGTLAALIEKESESNRKVISSLIESVKLLQGNTADRRYQRLIAELKKLDEYLGLLDRMARGDMLMKIEAQARSLTASPKDGAFLERLLALFGQPAFPANRICSLLLDLVIEAVGAERGFVLFYVPESTEGEIVAARNFQTRNLTLEEYNFSRTVLREAFDCGQPLLLEDASHDPSFARQASVIKFQIRSVIAAPICYGGRIVGCIYLENRAAASLFDEDDLKLAELASCLAAFYLHHARLLPFEFERSARVFFDAEKASREIIGQDPRVISVLDLIARIADSQATVLIEGESGTGKELAARALHYQSARRNKPFIAINCAAIPENLLESELFGYEKGAFTGASDRYIGRIEQGEGGTIFLDEVSELAYPLQAKLLRFLQSNEFHRLGGKDAIRVEVRILAATSKDLTALVREGKFHEALYYRLNVIPLRLPALREHKSDIPLLIDHFLAKFSAVYSKQVRAEKAVCDWLSEYAFPGNVRELENLMHRLVALATDDRIRIGDLPREMLESSGHRVDLAGDPIHLAWQTPPLDMDDLRRRRLAVRQALVEQERALVERAIEEAGGNLTEAARRLKLHRITLHKILKKSGSDE
jgi:transcriptional regulator with GAF, ATPase, and Fis domain